MSVDFFVVKTVVFQIDRIDGKTDGRQMSDASNLAGLIVLENRRKGSPTSDRPSSCGTCAQREIPLTKVAIKWIGPIPYR